MTTVPWWNTYLYNGKIYIVHRGADILNADLPATIELIVTMTCSKSITVV